jgi:type I restriction enzyme S subunit
MNKWKYEKLSELCSKIGDGLHGTPEYDDSDIYFINGNNLKNGKIEFTENTKTVSTEELSNFIELNNNSLLLSINGTLGSMAFYNGEKVILGKSAAYLNFNSNINKFYYYYFQLNSVQLHFYNVATGSTIKNLSLKSIQDFEVPFPTSNEWKKIVAVLSALDSKIELNNKINTELESMAKTLYDYWFVQFDFPDKDGNPYKTSGGKMVWNDELKREIPGGWEVKNLGDITSISNESINPMNSPNTNFKHYSIPTFDELGTYKVEKGEDIKSNKFTVEDTDVLVSKLNPHFSRVIYSTHDDNLICSTEFVVWRTSNIEIKNYMYMIARDYSFITFCTKSSAGTSNSHKRVNPTVMMKYKVAYQQRIAERFGSILGSTIKMYAKNQIENKTLSELRDWLLPMLMNGQVRVE